MNSICTSIRELPFEPSTALPGDDDSVIESFEYWTGTTDAAVRFSWRCRPDVAA